VHEAKSAGMVEFSEANSIPPGPVASFEGLLGVKAAPLVGEADDAALNEEGLALPNKLPPASTHGSTTLTSQRSKNKRQNLCCVPGVKSLEPWKRKPVMKVKDESPGLSKRVSKK